MSELPSKEVYKFINEFDSQQEFNEFSRSYLNLKTREINDISADHSGTREQKYQMICHWKRKVGRVGTIAKLYEYKEQHRVAKNEENDDGNTRTPVMQQEDADAGVDIRQHEARVEQLGEEAVLGGHNERAFMQNNAKPISTDDTKQASVSSSVKSVNSSSPDVISSAVAKMQDMRLQSEADYCADIGNLQVTPCTDKQIIAILTKGGMYPMLKLPKGYIIIINNTPAHYSKVGEKDAENMGKLWTALDCKVAKKPNLTASAIEDVFQKVKASPQVLCSDYLGFFIIGKSEIVSGREAIVTADNMPVFLDEIVETFNDANFGAFAGKPKLFFCHLLTAEDGQEVEVFPDQLMVISRTSCFRMRSNSCDSGCWFVNAIANVFARYSRTEPLQQLLQRVGSAVASKVASSRNGGSVCSETGIAIHDKLKALLYLLPGHPKDDLFD